MIKINLIDQIRDRFSHDQSVIDILDVELEEYDRYRSRFEKRFNDQYHRWIQNYDQTTADCFGGMDIETMSHLYALVRSQSPEIIVETGVCNGTSTFALLLAIDHNDRGKLYSIDYPHYSDEDLSEFRSETFDQYGGAVIPADRSPGWIVPEDLRHPWELHLGKSQRELPALLTKIDQMDLMLHDSEHSHPCQMLEYEIGWNHLSEGGLLVSDDVRWTDAWDIFTGVREVDDRELVDGFAVGRRQI